MTPAGFPHSDISGSLSARDSPKLFAACHVLHRLLAPRHPPRALCSLTSLNNQPKGQGQQTVSAVSCGACCAATFRLPLNAVAGTFALRRE